MNKLARGKTTSESGSSRHLAITSGTLSAISDIEINVFMIQYMYNSMSIRMLSTASSPYKEVDIRTQKLH